MQIRRLKPDDTDNYRALMLRAYEAHPDAFTSSTAERTAKPRDWWQARLNPAPTAAEVVVGAFHDSALIGVAGIAFDLREKASHKANIFGMYVDPAARGTGASKEILNELIKLATDRPGTHIVQLTVTEGNLAAEKLYTAAGFKAFGVEPFAVRVGNNYVSKVHMWLGLATDN